MSRLLPTREFLVRLGAELLIVFVGVSLAFLFDNYRETRAENRRQQQLECALLKDLAAYEYVSGLYLKQLRDGQAEFARLRAEGKRPSPFFLRIAGAERPPTDVWQAALQSGAGELLDPDVVLTLSTFYNEISGEAAKYERYALVTEQRVFPVLESDTSAFYDAAGELKPEFKAHGRQLDEIVTDLEAQSRRAGEILGEMGGPGRSSCNDSTGEEPAQAR